MADDGILIHEGSNFDGLISAGLNEFVYSSVPVPFRGAREFDPVCDSAVGAGNRRAVDSQRTDV